MTVVLSRTAESTPTPNPSPQGGGESRHIDPEPLVVWGQAAAAASPSPLWGGVRGGGKRRERPATILALFLSPVERGRGAERSEAEWGSTCVATSEFVP